ncbi:MAG: TraB/GumN family protein [Novosphingobium sp.]
MEAQDHILEGQRRRGLGHGIAHVADGPVGVNSIAGCRSIDAGPARAIASAMRFGFRPAVLACLVLIAACASPQPAAPALWQVEGSGGERGYLFGTVHALDRPARWRTAVVNEALAQSDRIVVEVANLASAGAMAETFDRLAYSPDQPPLSRRIAPALRAKLAAALTRAGMRDDQFTDVETWAAALTLARAGDDAKGTVNGIDRAVIAAADGKPVVELEGAQVQLGIFDRLAERDQRDLLAAVITDQDSETTSAAEAWRKGDMARIERETRRGLLADPELRAALFTRRNQAWAARIAAMLAAGAHPFVAVGAAHMAGPEGLPALLAASGYRVTRIE